ncbi:MAG: lipoyl(octanoyl) transferase LipB [Pseudomonadota bacterium]
MEWKISSQLIEYEDAVSFMEERVNQIKNNESQEMIWLLEHPPLYTAGSSAKTSDLLDNNGLKIYQTGRGGQYTYHGPGQRIAYIMLDLRKRTQDVRVFVKNLEDSIINTLAVFGIKGEIREGRVGVWVKSENSEAKIAAIGIRIRKWITYHGIAVNINPDLSNYNGIVPCGISQYGVTSFAELGIKTTLKEFDEQFIKSIHQIF